MSLTDHPVLIVAEIRRRRAESLKNLHETPLADGGDTEENLLHLEHVARMDGRVQAFTEALRIMGARD